MIAINMGYFIKVLKNLYLLWKYQKIRLFSNNYKVLSVIL